MQKDLLERCNSAAQDQYACTSACTMIMAYIPNDRLCFGESASLQFHASRNATSGEPSISTTQWMLNNYPQDIRRWIIARGGVDKMSVAQFWTLDAAELWAMGYRRCEAEAPPVPLLRSHYPHLSSRQLVRSKSEVRQVASRSAPTRRCQRRAGTCHDGRAADHDQDDPSKKRRLL
jgi:hypothetical protein